MNFSLGFAVGLFQNHGKVADRKLIGGTYLATGTLARVQFAVDATGNNYHTYSIKTYSYLDFTKVLIS
jgi:hypothetical protein